MTYNILAEGLVRGAGVACAWRTLRACGCPTAGSPTFPGDMSALVAPGCLELKPG